jgi:hypothetical protein
LQDRRRNPHTANTVVQRDRPETVARDRNNQ